MPLEADSHKSFIVRLWQKGDANTWCARVEAIGPEEEVKHFADAQQLVTFLENTICEEEFSAKEFSKTENSIEVKKERGNT